MMAAATPAASQPQPTRCSLTTAAFMLLHPCCTLVAVASVLQPRCSSLCPSKWKAWCHSTSAVQCGQGHSTLGVLCLDAEVLVPLCRSLCAAA